MRFVEVHASRRLLAFVLLVVPLALLLVSCGGSSSVGSDEAVHLRRSRALWARANVRDYAYTVRVGAFVPSAGLPARVTVRNGRTTTITPADGTADPLPDNGSYFVPFATVGSLFAVVQEAMNKRADSLDVDYDPVLGYPARISIDYIHLAVDDEVDVYVTQFEASR